MVNYTYTPTYYSSFHHTLTSICKSIFTPKSRRQLADSSSSSSSHLKWQQDSFHKILNLVGLHKEGIVSETEVSNFRSNLLETLVASPKDPEPACVVRDKLLFLQELFFAKCISADEYHSSKRPLLQRLAVEGVEINSRDVIVGNPALIAESPREEHWSEIELKDKDTPPPAEKPKSIFGWKSKGKKTDTDSDTCTVLMPASTNKPPKKQWGLDAIKKFKKVGAKENERAEGNSVNSCPLVAVDVKRELSRIRTELNTTNPKIKLSENQMEGILVDKEDLKSYFPKKWCEKYGDTVLDVARKELKDHTRFDGNEENCHPNLFFRDRSQFK